MTSVIIYKGQDVLCRKDYETGKVDVIDFDANIHQGEVITLPNGKIEEGCCHVWKWAKVENENEKQYLIKEGKIGFKSVL